MSTLGIAVVVASTAVITVGLYLGRRVDTAEPLVDAPRWVRIAAGALALGGPWLVESAVVVPGLGDPVAAVVTLTSTIALWLVADRVVGIVDRDGASAC